MSKQPTAVSGKIQRFILWVSAGTLLSVFGGIGTMLYTSGRYTKGIEDKIDLINERAVEQRSDFEKCKIDTDKKIDRVERVTEKISQAVAAHTGKPLNGRGQ